MNKETISGKQGICLMILFFAGSSAIMTRGIEAKQDLWLVIVLSVLFTLPMALIYARLHYVYKDKDLFDIIEICFGKLIGKVINLLFIIYLMIILVLVIRNIAQFIIIISMSNTPLIITIICVIILCIWASKEGIEVIGRCGEIFIIIFIAFILITLILLIPKMDINNLRPVLTSSITEIMQGIRLTFTFPFGEIIVFTMAFSSFNIKTSFYKVYIIGLIIGALLVMGISIVTVLVLGADYAKELYYPAYSAASRLNIGDVLQRLEATIAIVFILGGIIKASIYLLASSRGLAKVFECKDYRFIVIPIALMMINLTYSEFESIMHYIKWDIEVHSYYALLFQVFLPIIIWIIAEIKNKKSTLIL